MSDLFLKYLSKESNYSITDNGAVTYSSTGSFCLDLFMTIGALRNEDEENIYKLFQRAYVENKDYAMKILFYARDVREGLGERETYRRILVWLATHQLDSLLLNIDKIPEYGRFDDLLCLLGTPAESQIIKLIENQLRKDLADLSKGKPISLLAKWLPSINTSSYYTFAYASYLADKLGMSFAEYRKTLSKLRKQLKLVENNLRKRDYNDIDYSKLSSGALFKYRGAFARNDQDRYNEFLENVSEGHVKMNTGTLAPYEIVRRICAKDPYSIVDATKSLSKQERESLDVTWNALPDYTNGQNALVVMDGSGSMYSDRYSIRPITVALSLAIYFAERTTGEFKNHFITFSLSPKLVEIKGDDICDKVAYCSTFDEIANTNIEAVFKLILKTAVKYNMKQQDLPEVIYIISDMEFDSCAFYSGKTNFENAKQMFERYGYKLPSIVFWNVNARMNNCPVRKHETGTALVSGFSPKIFSMVIDKQLDPFDYMLKTILVDRYKNIVG